MRKIYTWKTYEDIYRKQLDYVLTRTRYKTSFKNSLSYQGADIGSNKGFDFSIIIKIILMQKNLNYFNCTLNLILIHLYLIIFGANLNIF